MTSTCDALVVGAGGFLGGHLIRSLLLQGLQVRAVDVRPLDAWSQVHPLAENRVTDVSVVHEAVAVTAGATTVYDLAAAAADATRVDRMTGVLADTHLLQAARDAGVDRFVFASSAVDAPAALAATTPDDRCWRHLFTERMARHFLEDFGLQTRVARLGPVYGEHDEHGPDGARAVATTVARRVAEAVATQRRSVQIPYRADDPAPQVYVDDAVLGLQLVAHGTEGCGPYAVVDPAPTTVATVVGTVLAAARTSLAVEYTVETDVPRVVGDPAALAAAVDWTPDIALPAAVDRYWSTTAVQVRRGLDVPPSVTERWAQRRTAAAHPAGRPARARAGSRVVGRHRYENAG